MPGDCSPAGRTERVVAEMVGGGFDPSSLRTLRYCVNYCATAYFFFFFFESRHLAGQTWDLSPACPYFGNPDM